MTVEIPRRGSLRAITDLPPTSDPTGFLEIERGGEFFSVDGSAFGGGDPALAPPDNPTAEDDEFNDAVLDPKWTWLNQGTSTAPLYLSRALLKFQPSGNGAVQRVAAIVQPVPPSSPQTWAAVVRIANYSIEAGLGGGPFAYRSGTGQFVTFNSFVRTAPPSGAPYTEQWAATRWTAFDTPTANPFGPTNTDEGRRYNYFQLRNDGTNLLFDYSPDMVQWINLGSVTLATGLGGDATHFGIGGNAASVAQSALLGVDWFRVRYTSTLQPN